MFMILLLVWEGSEMEIGVDNILLPATKGSETKNKHRMEFSLQYNLFQY